MNTGVLNIALRAADQAAEIVRAHRGAGFEVGFKSARDLVTSADVAAERAIIEIIRSDFPDHAIFAEESSATLSDPVRLRGPLWIIDPIDGTMNFAHGHDHVGISIAFADGGRVQAGVVLNPFTGERYVAALGGGATCNGAPIHPSAARDLTNTIFATGFPGQRDDLGVLIKRVEATVRNCRDMRRLGAASLDTCWVACGKLDAFYEDLKSWDIAAAGLIAREAGARTGHSCEVPVEYNGIEDLYANGYVVAAPGIYDDFRALLIRAAI